MKVLDIKVASNGYVCVTEDDWGMESTSIHTTLVDMATHVGETVPVQPVDKEYVRYNPNNFYPRERLQYIRSMARSGHKIDAIRLFRTMFSHTIGLKEAKDIVEVLMSD